MKYQALFYQKNNEKYSRLSSAAVVIGTLRVNKSQDHVGPVAHCDPPNLDLPFL